MSKFRGGLIRLLSCFLCGFHLDNYSFCFRDHGRYREINMRFSGVEGVRFEFWGMWEMKGLPGSLTGVGVHNPITTPVNVA